MAAISTRGLEVRYGDTAALIDVTIDVPKGASLAVIGPNGSGKSTLLGALAGTVRPHAGSVELVSSPPAFVLQSTEVDRSLPITVRDTVALARYAELGLIRRFRPADRDAVQQALERLQVADLAAKQLHELSGGQRQRVLVAQGLAQGAQILMLDEPVNGLDLVSRSVILDVMAAEVEADHTVVITTHSLEDASACDLVLLLDTAPIAFGTPSEVLADDHLQQAFGTSFVRIGDKVILDDPHHHHHH
jgi:manganese transport system ATP-binding protein